MNWNVVDQKDMDRAVAVPENRHLVEAGWMRDHFVGELFGRKVMNPAVRMVFEDVVADGVHEVRLCRAFDPP